MAEKEVKAVKETAKKEVSKAKAKKPSIFSRIGAWFKSCKSEMKKVVWASWPSVRKNTIMVLVCIIVISAVIGVVDVLLKQGFSILAEIF